MYQPPARHEEAQPAVSGASPERAKNAVEAAVVIYLTKEP
jgi:hypothetical protein